MHAVQDFDMDATSRETFGPVMQKVKTKAQKTRD